MHILITVFFNAPHGGLHENIFSTVKYCIKSGHRVSVLCKSGEFEERLKNIGVQVITTNFESIEDDIEKLLNANENDYEIIHTHPFASRKVAVPLSQKLGIPIVLTIHGMYDDELNNYIEKIDAVFTVSEGIKDNLKKHVEKFHEKIMVIPNGVNRSLFKPNKFPFLLKRKTNEEINISLVSRYDRDKKFIIQLFYKALNYTVNNYCNKVKWTIVGDGTELDSMKQKTDEIINGVKHEVNFVGWKSGKELLKYYLKSDIVIAPGRCALEAMSCRKPVIAIGSKRYNGLIDQNNWMQGVYTNFGGLGEKIDGYVEGSIEKDLKLIIEEESIRKKLGDLGVFITSQFYDETEINRKIVKIYEIL